uniref:Protein kinase domain-containing protein n=1 Tax=Panagrolaimus superbus TaxID=310955 RepID=A0A914YW70_9BILA
MDTRDILLLNNAYESSPNHRRHFLSIFDRGDFPDRYNYIILQLCDCNLSDLRTERLNGADYSRSSALHIASQTLQGIHDVQLHHYYHRDIRSGNFVVGLNEHHHMIYIVNFSLSYEYVARNHRLEHGKKSAVSE